MERERGKEKQHGFFIQLYYTHLQMMTGRSQGGKKLSYLFFCLFGSTGPAGRPQVSSQPAQRLEGGSCYYYRASLAGCVYFVSIISRCGSGSNFEVFVCGCLAPRRCSRRPVSLKYYYFVMSHLRARCPRGGPTPRCRRAPPPWE